MTVEQFQKIHKINNTTPDTVERLGWIVCDVFNYTQEEVNQMKPIKFLWLVNRLERKINAKPSKFYRNKLNEDAATITLGQFIECQHWLKNDVVQSMDLVAASILFKRTEHANDAAKARKMSYKNVYPSVLRFVESFNALILNFKWLFDIQEHEVEDTDEPIKAEALHPFIENYAWIFSAKEVATHEGITLDQAFNLPVIQALNALSYLKSKQDYDKKQSNA